MTPDTQLLGRPSSVDPPRTPSRKSPREPGAGDAFSGSGHTFPTSSWFLRYSACFSSIHFMSLKTELDWRNKYAPGLRQSQHLNQTQQNRGPDGRPQHLASAAGFWPPSCRAASESPCFPPYFPGGAWTESRQRQPASVGPLAPPRGQHSWPTPGTSGIWCHAGVTGPGTLTRRRQEPGSLGGCPSIHAQAHRRRQAFVLW